VKELEAQVAALKQTSNSVSADNERLKLSVQKLATENEILKATSHVNTSHSSPSPLPDAGPMRYNPKDFYTDVLHAHENKTPSHRIVTDQQTGSKLLAAGATWDYIIAHPLFKKGLVDVSMVSERLKTVAKCDGQGPVFEERAIVDAIEKSVASGSDELM
jgi:AP-1-like factor